MSLNEIINLLALVTLVELMVTIGLGVTFADVAGVARDWRLVSKAAIANYLCVPAAALGLLLLFQPQTLVAVGFLIAAVCPGAPYGPPFTGIARGNVIIAVGLMVLLAASSALAAPLLLQVLVPMVSGDPPLAIDVFKMVTTLLVAQLVPLAAGLSLRQWRPALAARLKKPAGLLSMVLNLTLLGMILVAQFDMLIGIPFRAYFGMFELVFASVAAGWLLGGPGQDRRTAMAMATSVRNVGVTLVIVTGSFPNTPAVTAATAFGIFQTLLMAVVAIGWGRWVRLHCMVQPQAALSGDAAPADAGPQPQSRSSKQPTVP
jgi:BASS family bile acid:Na+ symporter